SEFIADYLARTKSTRLDATGVERYFRFFREAPETKAKRMRDLTRRDFELYRERRRAQGDAPGCKRPRGQVSPTTVNKELRFAHAVFEDFLCQLDKRGDQPMPNPVRKLSLPEPEHRTRYLTDEEEARLQQAMAPTDWPPVLVAIMTGIDRGAMFTLEWTQVDFATRTIHTERRKGRRTGSIPVTVPINEELLQVLRALPSRLTSRWGVPNPYGTGPLDGDAFDRLVFQPALVQAQITGLCWKDLRHTF